MTTRTLVLAFGVCITVGALVFPPSSSAADDDPAQGTVWDLSPLFHDDNAWEMERREVEAALPALSGLKGTLGANPTAFREALDQVSRVTQRLERLNGYADLKLDVDAGSDANQARVQQMSTLQSQFRQATAFMPSEILSLGRERVEAFERAEPGLSRHSRQVELILRRAPHTLGPEGEGILAAAGPLQKQPEVIHDVLLYSEMPWPSLEIEGKLTPLTPEVYRASVFNPDREIRRKVFESVTATLHQYEGTAGAVAFAFLAGTAFEAKARHYPSSLALAVSDDAMPEATFQTMAAQAEKALPTLLRYLKLRQKILGLQELHVYDLRVPLTTHPHRYRLDEAEALILRALAPLGDDYVHELKNGFQSHAMHATANPGKAPGALTEFAYGVHPFVMVTFDGSLESVNAVAHEWGHAMHGLLFQSTQPFENADITSTFLSDTPSLTNEMLLSDYMIANAKTREEKVLALDRAIDLLRYSYFGVLNEVEYEVRAHEAADRGEAITGKDLTAMYCTLLKRFVGADQGVTKFDDSACYGWVNRPGIYYDFYFYKYLTAVSAAGFFVEGLERHDADTRKRFLELLRAGGSDDPYLLLKRAGFDAASPAAYQVMLERLERLVRQLEAMVQSNAR